MSGEELKRIERQLEIVKETLAVLPGVTPGFARTEGLYVQDVSVLVAEVRRLYSLLFEFDEEDTRNKDECDEIWYDNMAPVLSKLRGAAAELRCPASLT